MRFSAYGTWLAALSCLLCMGGKVQCDCTDTDIQIEGGHYTLTNQLKRGSVLIYHCPEGFYPDPQESHVCQMDDSWEPSHNRSQSCKMVECPNPNVLQEGYVTPYQNQYFVNQVTTYECYDGFTLQGSETRTCLPNGKWSGLTPICSQSSTEGYHCADPGIPAGATRDGNVFGINHKVTYSCSGDMFLVGSKERECLEGGEWTGMEPTCYFRFTYDTPEEVSRMFGGAIKTTLTTSDTSGGTQQGRSIRISKSGILNIYIAVDISQSIAEDEYKKAMKAILRLIDKVASFSVNPNYEIVFFSSKVHEIVNILDFYSGKMALNDIKSRVENFQVKDQRTGTNLMEVFKTFEERMAFIRVEVERKKKGSFQDHRHVIILFSDGDWNMGGSPHPVLKRIKNMVYMNHTGENELGSREDYLDVYVFALGTKIFDRELQSYKTGLGGQHYYRLTDLETFSQTLEKMINEDEVVDMCGLHREYETDDQRKVYPWWASLHIQNGADSKNCLGALVNAQFILTAAHCLSFGTVPEDITVEIGREIIRGVKTFRVHPEYNVNAKVDQGVAEFYDFDVALVQLKRDLHLTASVRPICLPCTKQTSDAMRLAGIESTCEKQEERLFDEGIESIKFLTKKGQDVRLKRAHAKLGTYRNDCIAAVVGATGITTKDPTVAVTDNFLCSGGEDHGIDHISCKGDSGGAVFKNYFGRTIQVAIVSWGTEQMCSSGDVVVSSQTARDFHLNLFKVVPFLKSVLGNDTQNDFIPIKFL